MKVVMDTDEVGRADGLPVSLEIGYNMINDGEDNSIRPLLWFETPMETVTVELSPAKARRLIRALEMLVDTLE